MNVISLFGSPRATSNSSALTNHFLSKMEEKGAHVERFYLNKMNYRGCQGCMGCKGASDRCVLKDDLAPVLDRMKDVDLLVLS
ncbi:MAG TPA: flavodoxin family protein, partial [Spirochaetota bacterium]